MKNCLQSFPQEVNKSKMFMKMTLLADAALNFCKICFLLHRYHCWNSAKRKKTAVHGALKITLWACKLNFKKLFVFTLFSTMYR